MALVPPMGRSGGILCGIKSDRFDVLHVSFDRHYIKANIFDKKMHLDLCLVVVYGAPQLEAREAFLASFAKCCSSLNAPTLIGGDFSIIRLRVRKTKLVVSQSSLICSTQLEMHMLLERLIFLEANLLGLIIGKIPLWKNWIEF